MKHQVLQTLSESVIHRRLLQARQAAEDGLRMGLNADEMVVAGLLPGVQTVCEEMKADTISVAECVRSIDAFYEALKALQPHLSQHRIGAPAKVMLGVIEGDVHDIGKTIVGKMLDIAGFEVYDLGRDVPIPKFIERAVEVDADIIALSTLMTTTMRNMERLIRRLEREGLRARFKVLVGGTPVTQSFTDAIGADGYGENCVEAVEVAKAVLGGSPT